MALAGQRTPTGNAPAPPLAHDGQLRRNHLGLERRRELLGLVEPQTEVGQASLLAMLNARDLGLGRHAGLQLRDQLHTPYQLRHQPTLFPRAWSLLEKGPTPTSLHALLQRWRGCDPARSPASSACDHPVGA